MRDTSEKLGERRALSLTLSAATWTRLEALQHDQQRESVAQVVHDAVEWYLRFRTAPEAEGLARLTPRQREVLKLIGEGFSNKGIATHLGISVKTVETHRTHLMKILNLHGIAGLVRFALRCGLIQLDN